MSSLTDRSLCCVHCIRSLALVWIWKSPESFLRLRALRLPLPPRSGPSCPVNPQLYTSPGASRSRAKTSNHLPQNQYPNQNQRNRSARHHQALYGQLNCRRGVHRQPQRSPIAPHSHHQYHRRQRPAIQQCGRPPPQKQPLPLLLL